MSDQIFQLLIIGLLSGIVSGLAGVGGGIVMVPAMVLFMGLSQHHAQGTSTATLLLPLGVSAVFNYYKEGYINWKFVAIMSITFLVGSYFGSKIAISLDQKMLKRVFGVLMFVTAFKMFFDSYK